MSSVSISSIPNSMKEIAEKFNALRWRMLITQVATMCFLMVAVILALWITLTAVDYYWELNLVWRQSLVWGICVLSAFVAGYSVLRQFRNVRSKVFVAKIERAFEPFGQRLRTILDAVDGRVSGPPEMLAALGNQTLGRWETLAPHQMIPWRRLVASTLACAVLFGTLLAMSLGGQDWKIAIQRAAGYEIPYTVLNVTPGDTKILEGTSLPIKLELAGRKNREVHLQIRPLSESEWVVYRLVADERLEFTYDWNKAASTIEYQFLTNVGDSAIHRIEVQPLIVAERVETIVTPPSYTGLDPRTFLSSEVTVLERSQVEVVIQANHVLVSASLATGTKSNKLIPQELPLSTHSNRVTFVLPTDSSLYWRVEASGQDGIPMAPVQGRLRVREDSAPVLRWLDPPDEIKVHTLAELPMSVQVSDDYGITESGIFFRIGDDEEFELVSMHSDQDGDRDSHFSTNVRLEEILPLESFSLTERDFVSYYAYAIDNREWGPQRVETDVRYIDIRPLRQFFSEQEMEPSNGGSRQRLIVQLDEIIRRQRGIINSTRRFDRSGGIRSPDSLKVLDRMAEAESELASLARFLAEFFLSRGNDDIEALSQAESTLLQAADSLYAANIPLSMVQEEDALRSLTEARRQVEQSILANPTRIQTSEFRQLTRQLQQKLRREAPKTELQIADSLERIAIEQEELGQRIARANSSAVASDASGQAEPEAASAEPGKREDWYGMQVDLLERVQNLESELSDRLSKSKLFAERLGDVKADMDQLSKSARDNELEGFPKASRETADKLREMGVQLSALAASEAISRIGALRDMTLAMANRERELVNAENPKARAWAARRLARRSQTLSELLSIPAEVGDVAMSEVSDALKEFARTNDLEDRITESLAVGESLAEEPLESESGDTGTTDDVSNGENANFSDNKTEKNAGLDRARDYADAADQLNNLYKQLVAPRLNRIRDLEQKASQLSMQMSESTGGKGGGEPSEMQGRRGQGEQETLTPGVQGQLDQLEKALRQEGLDELANALESEEAESGGSSDVHFGLNRKQNARGRVEWVVRKLREEIQEILLLEVAAEREAPVPSLYRSAVDGYYRTIAGEDSEL
ncbi:hypothetical protein SH449x_004912 [Pirellulaceae bacterium SH449]